MKVTIMALWIFMLLPQYADNWVLVQVAFVQTWEKPRVSELNSRTLAQAALRAPPEVALQCVPGHCYYHCFSSFFSPSFVFDPLQGYSRLWKFVGPGGFACANRGGVAMRNWPLLLPIFSFFSPSSAFDPLRRISRVWKFVGPGGFACATRDGICTA